MRWTVERSHHELDRKLDHMHELLHNLIERTQNMSAELDRLTASVAKVKTVADSAISLINQLSTLIRDNANDPAALTKLADDLDAEDQSLADAVAANTPATQTP